MKIFQSIQVSNSGLSCQQCIHFRNDPALIEDAFGGLRSLSSGFASVRDRDGICSYHRIYLSARDSCGDLVIREGVDEYFANLRGQTY
jgi:hypothetical protein